MDPGLPLIVPSIPPTPCRGPITSFNLCSNLRPTILTKPPPGRLHLLLYLLDLLLLGRRHLLRTRQHVTWTGAVERSYSVVARRDGFRSFYEGPDAWGNAQAFGRANYPVLHFTDVWKTKGREFMIDTSPGMSAGETLTVVYELFKGNVLHGVLHGVLTWEAGA